MRAVLNMWLGNDVNDNPAYARRSQTESKAYSTAHRIVKSTAGSRGREREATVKTFAVFRVPLLRR